MTSPPDRIDWPEREGLTTRRWRISGRVQGVGFRPFVYRLAHAHGLTGWVQNCMGEVEILTQGSPEAQERFGAALLAEAPPLARPRLDTVRPAVPGDYRDFRILESAETGEVDIHLPPDCFTCDDCLAELRDPNDRRYRYPFINCTQCGPRYTLIARLPYDRPHTSMAGFPPCAPCEREYRDPLDRRFHAEPVACPDCGPRLAFHENGIRIEETEAALAACVAALREGKIVAVKGVGGYHLLCDAANTEAIARLRAHKPRPDKPLAVMFPQPAEDPLARVREAVQLDAEMAAALVSPVRPIVLAPRRPDCPLPVSLAPGLRELGVFLPYSPLHHLLLDDFGGPLVATSGNRGGDPVLTEATEAERHLGQVAEAFLHHDRPILRPADDPVLRPIDGRCRPLRLGRGNAPLEIALPVDLPFPVLAAGGHMKNTLALGWGRRAIVSPHIGDMESVRSQALFARVAEDLQALYGVTAEAVVCDAHPGYATHRWARASGLPVTRVWHHAAHASALVGETVQEVELDGPWLVFAWDGVGLGPDGTLWGGETLWGRPGDWSRVATLRAFRLPGGERAAREPWRSALAMAWEAGCDWQPPHLDAPALDLLRQAWQRGLQAPVTHATGRLFDAAAALTGVCLNASYEGQGPARLEALAEAPSEALSLPLHRDGQGAWVADWQPLLEALLAPGEAAHKAGLVHATLAALITDIASRVAAERGVQAVGLCGGVFQNALLTRLARQRLQVEGFAVHLARRVPMNDAGLSFGQLVEFACGRQEADG